MKKKKTLVRDGYLKDLPNKIQSDLMSINKLISERINELLKDKKFNHLNENQWARSALDEFCTTPGAKSQVGSVRSYKIGADKYDCMIQISGHIVNHRNDFSGELLHDFLKIVHKSLKNTIKKKYKMRLDSEGLDGDSFEGFDVYPIDKDVCKDIWDSFEEFTTKTIVESVLEDIDEMNISDELFEYYEFYSEKMSYDEFFYEKSHGKLKYDFRAAINIKDGHILKVIYSLDNIKFPTPEESKGWGDGSYDRLIKGYNTDKERENDVRKHGNLDHESKGQKVLAIVDMITGKRIKSAECIGLFADSEIVLDSENMSLSEIRKAIKNSNDGAGDTYKIVEGKIDNRLSFKSTFWDSKIDKLIAKIRRETRINNKDDIFNKVIPVSSIISNRENTVTGRGHKLLNDGNSKYAEKEINDVQGIEIIERRLKIVLGKIIGKYKKCELNYEPIATFLYHYRNENIYKLQKMVYDTFNKSYNDNIGRAASYIYLVLDDDILRKIIDIDSKKFSITEYDIQRAKERYERRHSRNGKSVKNESAYNESTDNVPEYNVDMSEKQAKNTLRTLSQGIMNDIENKKDYKVSQYTANIYANIITKNLLPIWAKGFKKFSITLDSYQSFFTFEFKVPKMTQDFVARFVDGRESINGLIHREPEIKVKMSPRIFHTMKDPNDAYNFFKAAIQYYDSKLEKTSESLMLEIKKLGYGIKHLVSNTKLSGLVTYPMSLLFVFDDVQMYNKYIFRVSNDDINTINKFVRSIPSRYAAPEKEKAKIVEDIKELVKSLREKSSINESATDLFQFAEAVETYLNGGYDQLLQNAFDKFEYENTDIDWIRDPNNPQVKVLQEKFGVKKLKKIPVDLVAYISIETEAIRDANDKMMIASYCLGKIEIVEWYIELLEVGSKKYIVPHTKQYLESVRTQLLACYKKIMEVKISNTPLSDRPIVDIKYPKGYEG